MAKKIRRGIRIQSGKHICDRFATLTVNPVGWSSWLQAFGSVTLGSTALDYRKHVKCSNLNADAAAIAFDYNNVVARLENERRRIASAS